MADWFFGLLGGALGFAFQGAADQFLRTEADGEGESKNDTAKEDAEREANDAAADGELLERHGDGQDHDHPADADAEQARVFEVHVDGFDEDTARSEARDDASQNHYRQGREYVREVLEEAEYQGGGEGHVERGKADREADKNDGPENDADSEPGGALARRPIDNRRVSPVVHAVIEMEAVQRAPEDAGNEPGQRNGNEQRQDERCDSGKQGGDSAQHPRCRLAQGMLDLFPHSFSFRRPASRVETVGPSPTRHEVWFEVFIRACKALEPRFDFERILVRHL